MLSKNLRTSSEVYHKVKYVKCEKRHKCSVSQAFLPNYAIIIFWSNLWREKCIISADLDLIVWLEFPSLNVELIFSFKEIIFIEILLKHVLFKPQNAIPKFSVKINVDIGFRNLVCLQEYMYTLRFLYLKTRTTLKNDIILPFENTST